MADPAVTPAVEAPPVEAEIEPAGGGAEEWTGSALPPSPFVAIREEG